MHSQQIATVAKDVIESGRTTAKNVIATSHASTRRVLGACDQVWQAGTNTLGNNAGLISDQLRDDLISLQGQVTLLTRYFANNAAESTERAVNNVADAANSTVGEYEHVFDRRVMQAFTRVGMPVADVIRTLAELVASLSQEVAALVAIQRNQVVSTEGLPNKSAAKSPRKPARRTKRARAQ